MSEPLADSAVTPDRPIDRSDAVVVTHTPVDGPPEREVFEPIGTERWRRYDQVLDTEETWRTRGTELVERVAVEVGAEQ